MKRRQFLAGSLAASALVAVKEVAAQGDAPAGREYYQLRRYSLESGTEPKQIQSYLADAFVPAATRMGLGPVGAFSVDIGPETPTYYVLIPGTSLEKLVELDLHLADDAEFQKAAEPFWSAPPTGQPFHRVESSLMKAFEGWPKLTLPEASKTKGKRIFQLRTYESPSHRDHVRKVEMFNKGEFQIFDRVGMHSVFYADVLIGARMPCLTYMVSYESVAELDARWKAFGSDPEWKKLSSDPRYTFEPIVNNVTNLVLSPLAASQI